ncbi:MAG: pitrilysin family protein, partial [archaeon]
MRFIRKRLKNGIVVLFEKRDLPVVSFSISNRFGAAFEESKIKGIAHVIEHLLFTGTKTRSHEDISREIEKKGGILNAYTANEVTSYWFKLPSEHLFAGIDILVDMLKNAKFDPVKFEKEKRVILEEIKMYHDRPEVDVFRLLEEKMYDKPLGEGIIGSKETVAALKRDFVVDYFKKMYSPENFVVTIVGDADIDKVCRRMEKEFKPSGNKQQIKTIIKKKGDAKEERASIDQAHLVFGVHAPLASEKDFAAWEVMDAYLASGMSSRLFLKIREEKGLAYSVRSTFNTEGHYSYYTI